MGMTLAADLVLHLVGAKRDEVDAAITDALCALAAVGDAERAYVTMFRVDGTFDNSHEWTSTGIVPQQPAIQRVPLTDFPWSLGLALRDQTLNVRELDDLPPDADAERRSFGSFGVRSVLQVPIRVGGGLLGAIGFNRMTTTADWDDETIEIVRRVGLAIGVALERERSAEMLDAARDAVEEANHARDELLGLVSHELRSPLHAILGYTELLSLDDRPSDDRDSLDEIRANGEQLLYLVDDLIALASRPPDDMGGCTPLAPILDASIERLSEVMHGARVTFAHPDVSHIEIPASATRTGQLLYCALAAAMRSAPDDTLIEIEASAALTDSSPAMISVRVPRPVVADPEDLMLPLAANLLAGRGGVDYVRTTDAVAIELHFATRDEPELLAAGQAPSP